MTKEQMISKMVDKANKLAQSNDWDFLKVAEIWDMCSDWNREHDDYNEQIFMCDHDNDDNIVDGFYIEDDYWIFN